MSLIILYSAVYQLRVASQAHVNEITLPTCSSTFTQRGRSKSLRDQWTIHWQQQIWPER